MYWPVAFCGREGFCMILAWMEVFASVADVVLREDTSNCLIASMGFYDCPKGSMQLDEDGC